ncbi:MAG: hypothetical protein KDH86_03065 [Anaerolineae bacterium]|nr:hypothetical protein [Anaerolineae bacterium]
MRLVLTSGEGLNASSCDRLLSHLVDASSKEAGEVTIDLRSASFVDPYGMAMLVMVGRQLHRRDGRLICVLPGSDRPVQTIVQTGLLDALRPVAELRNLPKELSSRYPSALPATAIRSRNDVQTVVGHLVQMTRDRLGYNTGDVLDTAKVVSELCNNVVDHSGAEGIVLAQLGSDRYGARYVALAVADDGIGIRGSLTRRYPEAGQWQHGVAIERALGGLSSRETGGGAGLRSVTAVVRRYQGRLTVRSGTDRVYVSADRTPKVHTGALFPGTLVGISFSQRP